MADRFFLSVWLKDYDAGNMLDRFRVVLETFPYSESRPLIQSVQVHPLSFSEQPVLEEDFAEGAETQHVLALVSEFLHGDYAYEAVAYWDLWVFQKNGGPAAWKKVARPVTLLCFGPEFDEGEAEQGHLQVHFGLDTPFRADQQLPDAHARVMARDYRQRLQENIRKLLDFIRDLRNRLPTDKQVLWTESGENFAAMIRQSME